MNKVHNHQTVKEEKTPNITEDIPNITESEPNITIYKCDECDKVLSNKTKYNNHKKICKGVSNPLECHYCHIVFPYATSKCRHLKICKDKPKDIEPTIINNIDNSTNNIDNSNSNNNNNNNIDNSTTNNIVNNNNTIINIVPFDRNLKEITPFISDHINAKDMNSMLLNSMTNENNIQLLFSDYFKKIYDKEENRCIKKTNVKLDYSKVHIGNGEWQLMVDKEFYGKLIQDLSTNLILKIDENDCEIQKSFKKNLLTTFIGLYQLIESYTGKIYEDEKVLLKSMKDTTKSIRCVILDYTKRLK
jgi:hypothetical protein